MLHNIHENNYEKDLRRMVSIKTQKEALDLANDLNSKSELYHDWTKVTRLIGGWDKDLILRSYSPDNIK